MELIFLVDFIGGLWKTLNHSKWKATIIISERDYLVVCALYVRKIPNFTRRSSSGNLLVRKFCMLKFKWILISISILINWYALWIELFHVKIIKYQSNTFLKVQLYWFYIFCNIWCYFSNFFVVHIQLKKDMQSF